MRIFFITALSLILSVSLSAQTAKLTGIVADASNNEPSPFANVIVEGTTIGTTTDFDGNFTLEKLEPGYINLQVSFIGYDTKISQDILVNNNSVPFIEININASQQVLEEVVITVDRFEKREEAPISMQSIGIKEEYNFTSRF